MTKDFDPQAEAISHAFEQIARHVAQIADILGRRDDLNDTVPEGWPLAMSADEFEAQCWEMYHHYAKLARGETKKTETVEEEFLSFVDFQAKARRVADIGAEISADLDGVRPGILYPGGLYIECQNQHWSEPAKNNGAYLLIIGRDDWISDDLELLERKLYEFGVDEGYLTKPMETTK